MRKLDVHFTDHNGIRAKVLCSDLQLVKRIIELLTALTDERYTPPVNKIEIEFLDE